MITVNSYPASLTSRCSMQLYVTLVDPENVHASTHLWIQNNCNSSHSELFNYAQKPALSKINDSCLSQLLTLIPETLVIMNVDVAPSDPSFMKACIVHSSNFNSVSMLSARSTSWQLNLIRQIIFYPTLIINLALQTCQLASKSNIFKLYYNRFNILSTPWSQTTQIYLRSYHNYRLISFLCNLMATVSYPPYMVKYQWMNSANPW